MAGGAAGGGSMGEPKQPPQLSGRWASSHRPGAEDIAYDGIFVNKAYDQDAIDYGVKITRPTPVGGPGTSTSSSSRCDTGGPN